MARAPNPKREQAKQLYLRGYKLVDIAEELDVPPGTIRRWKHEGKWEKKRSEKKSERKNRKTVVKKDEVKEAVKEVLENGGLTDKQRLFCIYYIRCFNATKAYQKAYKCSHESAMSAGSRLLRKENIQAEIKKLKQSKLNREMLSEDDIFQKYMDIAFADITDYVEFGRKDVPAFDKEGNVLSVQVDYCNIKNSDEIDGTIVSKITQGKYGTEVRLEDRMKALEWLSNHMDLATTEQKMNIEKIKADIELTKAKTKEVNSKSIL